VLNSLSIPSDERDSRESRSDSESTLDRWRERDAPAARFGRSFAFSKP